jgi:hypothetical protein
MWTPALFLLRMGFDTRWSPGLVEQSHPEEVEVLSDGPLGHPPTSGAARSTTLQAYISYP